LMTYANPHLC